MKTITLCGNRVVVTEVASHSGFLDTKTTFNETLYRDARGQFYLEEERARGRAKESRTKPLSDKSAMMWFVESHVFDEAFSQMFIWMIVGSNRPASSVIVQFPQQGRAVMAGGAR